MRKHLFKGFYSNKNGTAEITMNGEKIKGEWIYWTHFGTIVNPANYKRVSFHGCYLISNTFVIPETIGEYVKEDCKGAKAFENDIVRCEFVDEELGTIKATGVIEWDNKSACYLINVQGACKWLDISFHPEIEVIGNIYDTSD